MPWLSRIKKKNYEKQRQLLKTGVIKKIVESKPKKAYILNTTDRMQNIAEGIVIKYGKFKNVNYITYESWNIQTFIHSHAFKACTIKTNFVLRLFC